MTLRRVVRHPMTDDPPAPAALCRTLPGPAPGADPGLAIMLAAGDAPVQRIFAGWGGMPVPAVAVDDVEPTPARPRAADGIVEDRAPWMIPRGLRRFLLRDPAGHLISIRRHVRSPEVS